LILIHAHSFFPITIDKDDPTAVLARKESETQKAGLIEV
jgi:hypothetical protein